MRVYIITLEPYHDNGSIVSVFFTEQEAREFVLNAARVPEWLFGDSELELQEWIADKQVGKRLMSCQRESSPQLYLDDFWQVERIAGSHSYLYICDGDWRTMREAKRLEKASS